MAFLSKLERAVSIQKESPSSKGEAPQPSQLDDLREKMARILGTDAPKEAEKPRDAFTELPFVRKETEHGALYLRRRRLDPAYRLGHADIAHASLANPEVLALLALDPELADCDPARALYLDTETTGLAGGTGTIVFLLGLAWFDGSSLVLEQLLLRQLGEEAPILAFLAKRMRRASMLVSYNGKSFDLPLLRTRAVMSRMPALIEKPHLDLVHVARRLHRKRIGPCNLPAIESNILGFTREGDIPSNEIAPRFAHFLRTNDESSLAPIVEHNDWDVISMAALVGLYGEPLNRLSAMDLPSLARTYRRAGSLDAASVVAEEAVARGERGEALRVRGEIAKARGDKTRALIDFARALEEIDDPGLRLELAKLYEHHAREPLAALNLVYEGTGEGEEAERRRRARLEAKLRRQSRRSS